MLWYFVILPPLWLVLGVPMLVSVFLSSRRGGGRSLGRRLSHAVGGWRSSWRYHFAEMFEIFGGLNRWLARGSSRRY